MTNFYSFKGIAKRQEYWALIILAFVTSIIAVTQDMGATDDGTVFVALVMMVAAAWLQIAVTVRRLRDAGLNTWWAAVLLVPVASFVATIVFGCLASVEGPKDE